MAFARRLRELLSFREELVPGDLAKGEPLESVLDRYLLTVESTAESDTVTSILSRLRTVKEWRTGADDSSHGHEDFNRTLADPTRTSIARSLLTPGGLYACARC